MQFHYRKTHGLTEETMPKIEREIPYTLSAYSGGLVAETNEGPSAGGRRRRSRDAVAGPNKAKK